jgi:hypothetical protein
MQASFLLFQNMLYVADTQNATERESSAFRRQAALASNRKRLQSPATSLAPPSGRVLK